ncbi:hypothetical protein OROGR_024349 [Orobanche gracilis]
MSSKTKTKETGVRTVNPQSGNMIPPPPLGYPKMMYQVEENGHASSTTTRSKDGSHGESFWYRWGGFSKRLSEAQPPPNRENQPRIVYKWR